MRRILKCIVLGLGVTLAVAVWRLYSAWDEVRGVLRSLEATAYAEWAGGEKAQNLELAIAAYEQALQTLTRDRFPYYWALTQRGLGIAYRDRIRGNRADNIEKAIAAYEAALAVFTREAMPIEWAATQHILGGAYHYRVRDDRADNLEKAIAAYEAALTVRTREARPRAWAATQNNLGGAYLDRIRGDHFDNHDKAIAAYEAALSVFTREALPGDWADIQNNIGIAYQSRPRGERADNLEKAIASYEAALSMYTREALPHDWAMAQHNLGGAYQARLHGERADNLERAIAAFEKALTVRTRESRPREWAMTQRDVGSAYRVRIRGEKADNTEKAIAAFEKALTVFTREALPRDHLRTAVLLGGTLIQARQWGRASVVYASARDTFLLLFGQGLNDAEARDLIFRRGYIFSEAALAAAQLGDNKAALALASEGRARMLGVALKQRALGIPDELLAAVRVADHKVEAAHGSERGVAVDRVTGLRRELLERMADAGASRGSPAATLAQARSVAGTSGAVVVPIVTQFGGKMLIATNAHGTSATPADQSRPEDPSITIVDLPELTYVRLNLLLRGDAGAGKSGGWLDAYNINFLPDAEQDRRWPEWLAAVGDLGPELWRLFAARLDEALKRSGVEAGARLVWLPTGALGILPLGLAENPVTKRRLADAYEIVYAPSLEVIAAAQGRLSNSAPPTLAAIVNPTGDLEGTEKEGTLVASYFAGEQRTVLTRTAATPDAVIAALKGRTHWHFASHGMFSWQDARQSALVMYGNVPLSVGRLLETDGLGQPRLVVLSACETGLYEFRFANDEFIGLPGTFTALGAAGVIGTLWPVSDVATALLMARFYELHMGQGLAPPTALSRAQKWLRDSSDADLAAYARNAAKEGRLESRDVAEIEHALSEDGLSRSRNRALVEWIAPDGARTPGTTKTPPGTPVARPYAHPYYWAGFIYTGL